MPITRGEVSINSPSAGADVIAGNVRVSGVATSGHFEKPGGTFEADLPPVGVSVRVDGGVPQPATQLAPNWGAWSANVQVTSGGPHTLTAVARGAAWTSLPASVTVDAIVPQMAIAGVEHTQSIQFFGFNNQGSAAGPDNSVPLVSQKSTVLRVYAPSVPGQPLPSGVSGSLTVGFDPPLLPSNGPIPARPQATIDRGVADHTLNFLIPASRCTGTLACRVRLFDPARPTLSQAEAAFSLTFQPTPQLRVHGVLVHYTGQGLNVTAPSEANFMATLGTFARLGPISAVNYTGFTVIDSADDVSHGSPQAIAIVNATGGSYTLTKGGQTTAPIAYNANAAIVKANLDALANVTAAQVTGSGTTVDPFIVTFPVGEYGPLAASPALTPAGADVVITDTPACGPGWEHLLTTLQLMRAGSGDLYVALLPSGFPPIPRRALGCGSIGVAAAFENDNFTMAEECGHALNRRHAPCLSSDADPSYPIYVNQQTGVPFAAGSIGEFGLSVANWSVFNPAAAKDFMGHCVPEWVSPYTYTGMRDRIAATMPLPLAARAREGVPPGEQLHLSIRIHRDDVVEVLRGFHLPGPAPSAENESPSSAGCDLIDADGKVLASHRFRRQPLESSDAAYAQYHGVLAWDPAAVAIAVWRDDRGIIFTHDIEAEPPGLSVRPPSPVDDRASRVLLEWTVEHEGGGSLEYAVRYSDNDGARWMTLAVGLTEPRYIVDLARVPGGERCRLQVVASSGIRTAFAETASFAVPRKPASAHILTPADGAQVDEGQLLELTGCGFSPDVGTIAFDDMLWISDRDGVLGVGHEVFVSSLSPGRHDLELVIPDGLGSESTATVTVDVGRGVSTSS